MSKTVRFIALGFIAAGFILAFQYVGSMNADKLLNAQLKETFEAAKTTQSASVLDQTGPTENTQPSKMETVVTEVETIETSMQKPDPFAGLRQPTWTIVDNPLMSLYEKNNDLVGWIKIDDTRIDYPIVKGKDNDFYLERDFNRQASRAGSIFMDYRNIGDFQDKHTIIYGHRMKNTTMFADLVRFKDSKFYESHRIIAIDTLYGRKEYELFAAYTTSTDFYFIETRFDALTQQDFIDEIQKRSDHDWDVAIDENDRILTLATCAYDYEDARFVVHARLLDS